MHVIAKPALVEFWKGHPDAENPLRAWYRVMETEVFADFNDLRKTFASADYVGGLTVIRHRRQQVPFDCLDPLQPAQGLYPHRSDSRTV